MLLQQEPPSDPTLDFPVYVTYAELAEYSSCHNLRIRDIDVKMKKGWVRIQDEEAKIEELENFFNSNITERDIRVKRVTSLNPRPTAYGQIGNAYVYLNSSLYKLTVKEKYFKTLSKGQYFRIKGHAINHQNQFINTDYATVTGTSDQHSSASGSITTTHNMISKVIELDASEISCSDTEGGHKYIHRVWNVWIGRCEQQQLY
ncbi:unnamed protein product [Mytilus edulis]|uniref:Uncharacterized protein n=1 Tax=Mytilus edulis TaxID=6550 RepID=A0A8S3SBM3_MYTED|nr:unnamed protein product [Mytilus edulis]